MPAATAPQRIWARKTPEATRTSTLIGLAELALSGCTTMFDHSYVWSGSSVDDQIATAQEFGSRFHVSRGSMPLGESQGGLPPDETCEGEDSPSRLRSASCSTVSPHTPGSNAYADWYQRQHEDHHTMIESNDVTQVQGRRRIVRE